MTEQDEARIREIIREEIALDRARQHAIVRDAMRTVGPARSVTAAGPHSDLERRVVEIAGRVAREVIAADVRSPVPPAPRRALQT